nr:NADH dehydrogenase subunit 2 [Malassezia sp.]
MLAISLFSFIIAVPIFAKRISATVFSRILSIIFLFSAVLTWNSLYYFPINNGVGIFSGLFQVSSITLGFQLLVFVTSALILFAWGPVPTHYHYLDNKAKIPVESTQIQINSNFIHYNTIREYNLITLFAVIGSCLLISSYNFVSMYMAIELQSLAAYILCTLYRDSESATSAGLKYFLLGSLASTIIVLGAGIVYAGTGITNFEDLAILISVGDYGSDPSFVSVCTLGGILLIGIGYIFKVGAAPLYNWAPDVYDGVPTIVTTWVSTMPKIGILVVLLNISFITTGYNFGWAQDSLSSIYTVYGQSFQTLLLVCSVLSFIIGSIVGLSQVRIKRLLTFSTINHVGFLLLALAVSTEESIEGFSFYLIQYTLTNVNTFLTLLAFGYVSKGVIERNKVREFTLLDDLKGQFFTNPLLAISFSVSLFSMTGIPPLMGFFAKQLVLYSVSYNYSFVAIIAIVMSVISASYYIKIVQLMFFNKDYASVVNSKNEEPDMVSMTPGKGQPLITSSHSTVITILTFIIAFYLLDPSILLNSCKLLSLSLFNS